MIYIRVTIYYDIASSPLSRAYYEGAILLSDKVNSAFGEYGRSGTGEDPVRAKQARLEGRFTNSLYILSFCAHTHTN